MKEETIYSTYNELYNEKNYSINDLRDLFDKKKFEKNNVYVLVEPKESYACSYIENENLYFWYLQQTNPIATAEYLKYYSIELIIIPKDLKYNSCELVTTECGYRL